MALHDTRRRHVTHDATLHYVTHITNCDATPPHVTWQNNKPHYATLHFMLHGKNMKQCFSVYHQTLHNTAPHYIMLRVTPWITLDHTSPHCKKNKNKRLQDIQDMTNICAPFPTSLCLSLRMEIWLLSAFLILNKTTRTLSLFLSSSISISVRNKQSI